MFLVHAGSAAYIHTGCLKQWHIKMANPTQTPECPTCKQMYFGEVAVELAQLNLLKVQTNIRSYGELALAAAMNTLALFYNRQGRPNDALPLYEVSHAIREKNLGPVRFSTSHPLPVPFLRGYITSHKLLGCDRGSMQ